MSSAPEGVTTGPTTPEVEARNSAQAGFVPISLRHAPPNAFDDIDVFLRNEDRKAGQDAFTLYRSVSVTFGPDDRARLQQASVKYVYIRIADHSRFREKVEATLENLVRDPTRAASEKAAIVYETSRALIDEIVSDPSVAHRTGRVTNVSRSIATYVLDDPQAFHHLFEASAHDFYTATHMVNVGTWMVPLAYALGHTDSTELQLICQAGLLHDLGKRSVPAEVLNKVGRLSEEDWTHIKRHPLTGAEHLRLCEHLDPRIIRVCLEHHERPDGKGYPHRLVLDKIHPWSRMCSVVDAFDAMTALRPFKEKALSVSEAIVRLRGGVPNQFDGQIVETWISLLSNVDDADVRERTVPGLESAPDGPGRRRHQRFRCNCQAQLIALVRRPEGTWEELPPVAMEARDISRFGLGLLSKTPISAGLFVRIHLYGSRWAGKRLIGKTVRTLRSDDGWYEIGVELFPPDSPKWPLNERRATR